MCFQRKISLPFRLTALFLSLVLALPVYSAGVLDLPVPGTMVNISRSYMPVSLIGLRTDAQDPFKFNFIVDSGDSSAQAQKETESLMEYFLGVLAIPRKDLWVNLSPYEAGRIVPDSLSVTTLGRDLLAQDCLLKQLAASLTHPESEAGRKYWQSLPGNNFNKVWIVPDKAEVYRNGDSVFITEAKLKVMVEDDYKAMQQNQGQPGADRGSSFKAHILPLIEKEVNEGKNFAKLRQIYSALILAMWYKQNLRETVLNRAYSDKSIVDGIDNNDKTVNEDIYAQYVESFQKGAYKIIKNERVASRIVKRQYFSGGFGVPKGFKVTQTGKKERIRKPKGNPIEVEVAFTRNGMSQSKQNRRIAGELRRVENGLAKHGYRVDYNKADDYFDFFKAAQDAGGEITAGNTRLKIVDMLIGGYGRFKILQVISPWIKGGHAGRGSNGLVIYAANMEEAVHELHELTAWIKYVLSTRIATVNDIEDGKLGAKLREWAADNVDRQNLLIRKYFQFHHEGVLAQYEGVVNSDVAKQAIREAEILARQPPQLNSAIKDFDVAIAADGLINRTVKSLATIVLAASTMACSSFMANSPMMENAYFPSDRVDEQSTMDFWQWMQKYRQEDINSGSLNMAALRKVVENKNFIRVSSREDNNGKLSLARGLINFINLSKRNIDELSINEGLDIVLENNSLRALRGVISKKSKVNIVSHEGFGVSTELMGNISSRLGAPHKLYSSGNDVDKEDIIDALIDTPFNPEGENVWVFFGHGLKRGSGVTLTAVEDESRDSSYNPSDVLSPEELANALILRAQHVYGAAHSRRVDDMILILPSCYSADFADRFFKILRQAYDFGDISSLPTVIASANKGTMSNAASFLGLTEDVNIFIKAIDKVTSKKGSFTFGDFSEIGKLSGVLGSDMVIFSPPADGKIVERIKQFARFTDDGETSARAAETVIFADMIGNKADVKVDKIGDGYKAKVTALADEGGGDLGDLNLRLMVNSADELNNVGRLLTQSGLDENDPVLKFFHGLLSQAPELYTYDEQIRDIFGLSPKEHNITALYAGMMRLNALQRAIALWHELAHNANNRGMLDLAVVERDGKQILQVFSGPAGIGELQGEIELTNDVAQQLAEQSKTSERDRFHYLMRALQRQVFGKTDIDLTDSIIAMQNGEQNTVPTGGVDMRGEFKIKVTGESSLSGSQLSIGDEPIIDSLSPVILNLKPIADFNLLLN